MEIGQILAILNDNRHNIKLGSMGIMVALFFSGYIQNILINSCIFGYLSFKSMKYLEDSTNKEYSDVLLKQWVLFSGFIVSEYILSMLFSLMFMSVIYNGLKVAAMILLLQDSYNLMFMYDLAMVPFYNSIKGNVESFYGYLESEADKFKSKSKELSVDKKDYNVMNFIMPYVNKVKSLF